MDIKEYLDNPCGSLSIPYWKNKIIKQPSHIHIFHEKEYVEGKTKYLKVERYFRLIHRLKETSIENRMIQTIDLENDIDELIKMINISYKLEKIKISKSDIQSWLLRDVYHQDLWVNIKKQGKIIASGIGEFDQETKEGILEWIQVLPEYQGLGYGKLIVNALISRLSKKANFITVSGRLDNLSNPKNLYMDCGFEGNDVWYVCRRK